jgi:hypothetical protein
VFAFGIKDSQKRDNRWGISDTPLTRSEGLLGLTPSYLLRALENYLRISQDT